MDYAWYFSQSEMEKYLEWIITSSSNLTSLFKLKVYVFVLCVCFLLNDSQNFLIHLLSRYVGINATEINHSAGRYHPGQSPPLEAGLEVRVKKNLERRSQKPIYNGTPPYGHLGNMVTSLLWPPCFGHPGKMAIHFLVKKPWLIGSPRYYGQFFLARWWPY